MLSHMYINLSYIHIGIYLIDRYIHMSIYIYICTYVCIYIYIFLCISQLWEAADRNRRLLASEQGWEDALQRAHTPGSRAL